MSGRRAALTLVVTGRPVGNPRHNGSSEAAFAEVCVLLAAIVALIAAAARHHGWAAVLLVPYLAWAGYAAALNLAIWTGN